MNRNDDTSKALQEARQLREQREAERDARMLKLHSEGYSDDQIGRIVGLSMRRITEWRQQKKLAGNGTGLDL